MITIRSLSFWRHEHVHIICIFISFTHHLYWHDPFCPCPQRPEPEHVCGRDAGNAGPQEEGWPPQGHPRPAEKIRDHSEHVGDVWLPVLLRGAFPRFPSPFFRSSLFRSEEEVEGRKDKMEMGWKEECYLGYFPPFFPHILHGAVETISVWRKRDVGK